MRIESAELTRPIRITASTGDDPIDTDTYVCRTFGDLIEAIETEASTWVWSASFVREWLSMNTVFVMLDGFTTETDFHSKPYPGQTDHVPVLNMLKIEAL